MNSREKNQWVCQLSDGSIQPIRQVSIPSMSSIYGKFSTDVELLAVSLPKRIAGRMNPTNGLMIKMRTIATLVTLKGAHRLRYSHITIYTSPLPDFPETRQNARV